MAVYIRPLSIFDKNISVVINADLNFHICFRNFGFESRPLCVSCSHINSCPMCPSVGFTLESKMIPLVAMLFLSADELPSAGVSHWFHHQPSGG